jgi:hypothetical protein
MISMPKTVHLLLCGPRDGEVWDLGSNVCQRPYHRLFLFENHIYIYPIYVVWDLGSNVCQRP